MRQPAPRRPDAILACDRSDYPNQINNVLGFPFIFRGTRNVRARQVNEEMKVAASLALAKLVKEPVPADVTAAYTVKHLESGVIISSPSRSINGCACGNRRL